MAAEENDLRSTLEEAFDAQSEAGRPATDATEPVRPAGETPATGTEAQSREDGRDERGRFARGEGKDPAGGPAGKQPAVDAAGGAPAAEAAKTEVGDQFAKAPQSWKPGAREAWTHLPPDVRAEVYRREKETARLVQESAQARQVTDFVGKLQQQFAPALQAEGVDALTASANLMNLASRLRFGTPVEKATLAAQIIKNYGVDVQALALALDGMPVQAQQQPMMQDPRVDQLLAKLEDMEQTRASRVMTAAVSEVEQFGSDKEFFQDVREDMADILELMAKRGVDVTLEQAYDRACAMNPEISRVLSARAAAQQAGTAQQSTQRAKAAASSIRGTPVSGSTPAPADLRGAIESAIEQVGGR